MPFSGANPEDLREVVDFIKEVDSRYGMGVEALDCILSEWGRGENPHHALKAGMWAAACEWDL